MGSRSQTTDTTMPNYWWPPSPQHGDEETDDSQTEDEEEEDSSQGEEEDNEEHEDSDGQHRQHNAFWKGFRAAIKGYTSLSSSEGEEEDDQENVHFDQDNVKEDEDHDEHEQEDGRPYSRSRTPRCSSRCKYYPCDRPIRSPRSSSPVVGPYRPSEAHLLESDYDSDAEENYV